MRKFKNYENFRFVAIKYLGTILEKDTFKDLYNIWDNNQVY